MSDHPSFFDVLSRCLRSRCPVCARGRLFARLERIGSLTELFLPVQNCDSCDFHFARQPGYYLGVVTPILPLLALTMGAAFLGIAFFVFDQELEVALCWGAVGLCVGLLTLFRTSVAIYVALDHAIDPPPKKMP